MKRQSLQKVREFVGPARGLRGACLLYGIIALSACGGSVNDGEGNQHAADGGSTSTGGRTAAGGRSAMGGTTSRTGGTSSTGGTTPQTGGTTSAGGTTSTGGTTSQAGDTSYSGGPSSGIYNDPTPYDHSCHTIDDCTEVAYGDPCGCQCGGSFLSKAGAEAYLKDYVHCPHEGLACPCVMSPPPVCRGASDGGIGACDHRTFEVP